MQLCMRYDFADFVIGRVQFTVINGEGRSDEFVEHLKGAAEAVREIITAKADSG
jgi:hypothetical protein